MNNDLIMQESKKTYKEGDLVKICTNKCNVHLMEMFGHCEFNPDEITADEYIALITAVIGNEQCYSVTIFTGYGECYHIIDDEEIIGPASIDELPEDKRDKAIWKNPINEIMFESELYSDNGLKPNTRRISLAVAAVSNLHPEGTIRVVEMSPSQSFLREAIYKDMDNTLAKCNNLSDERRVELKKSQKNLLKWFDTLRFEEHYEYHIGLDELNCKVYKEPATISYYIVAVNSAGTKAFVMKDRSDQSLFFDYLGPDFKNIFFEAEHFKSECIK